MSIGERIQDLRKAQNLSQGQLASALSISRQAVSKWENDQSSPDTIKLIQLADLLDTEVEYLATGRKPVYEPAPIVVNVLKKEESAPVKIIEKPVYKKIIRTKYVRNPVEFTIVGILGLLIGLVIGLLF